MVLATRNRAGPRCRPGIPVPEDQIIIHGANSGSTLELEVKGHGKRLMVHGPRISEPARTKFIGNGEPDTCYSEGSRRNRCVGGSGRDICTTGNRNNDTVAGRQGVTVRVAFIPSSSWPGMLHQRR